MGNWITIAVAFTFIGALAIVWLLLLVAAMKCETGWRRLAWVSAIVILNLPGALLYFVYWTMLRNTFTRPTLIQTAAAAEHTRLNNRH